MVSLSAAFLFDPRHRIELRYFSNEGKVTWSKISKQMNISIQTAINLHERGRLILSKKIKSKNS
ncbi:MAG: hypothetical protein VXW13_06680, partial [SAR324 cluster bacterium]|nr:hypothetical protein [SAR324 cluster bacterium]